MIDENYKIIRSNIYAGIILRKQNIKLYDKNINELNSDFLKIKGINVNLTNSFICRKILFKIINNRAIDLIYTSPDYAIDGITNNNDEKFIVVNSINLDSLLKYYNFNYNLSNKDIKKIYNMFFKEKAMNFYLNNCDLFGYKELDSYDIRLFVPSDDKHPIDKEIWQMRHIIEKSEKPTADEKQAKKIKKKIKTII